MASIINASTTAGLVNTADTSGILQLQTAGTTAVTVDASQNVTFAGVTTLQAGTAALPALTTSGDTNTGIFFPAADSVATTVAGVEGTRLTSTGFGIGTTPAGPLDVKAANAGGGGGIRLTSTTGTNGVNMKVSNTAGNLYFGIDTSAGGTFGNANAGLIWYDGSYPLIFATGNGKVLSIERNKSLALQDATPATGTGITFPATQSASTDAQTLDDYEEGTWTPEMSFGNDTTGITYSTQVGTYEKIGRQVTARCMVILSNNGSGSGIAKLSGFPFTLASGSNVSASFSIWVDITLSGTYYVSAHPQASQTFAYFRMSDAYMTETQFTNTANFTFMTSYNV